MKIRRILTATAGAIGATALANRLVASRAVELPPPDTGEERSYRWRGIDVAYREGGDPSDTDLVLIHGIHAAASGWEYDRVFDQLSEEYHLLVPDLPGFGRSDRPPLPYTASLYTAFLDDFVKDLTTDPIGIASSLSAGYATAVQRDSAPFERLVLVNPTANTGRQRAWLRALVRSPVVGTGLFNLIVCKPLLRYFGAREAVYDPAALSTDAIDYWWQTAHQAGARYAPASFISGHLDPAIDLPDALASLQVPITLIWGENAPFPTVDAGRELATTVDATLIVVDETRLLPHVEHPEEFIAGLAKDLSVLPSG